MVYSQLDLQSYEDQKTNHIFPNSSLFWSIFAHLLVEKRYPTATIFATSHIRHI